MNRSQTNFQNKEMGLLSPSQIQQDGRLSNDPNRTSYGFIEAKQNQMKPMFSAANLHRDTSTTAYSMATFKNHRVPMLNNQSNTTSEIRIGMNNNSSRIIPEEYKRLMLVKDPNTNELIS